LIDALKTDEIIDKVGGRFRLSALLQRRWLELLQGARPMVNPAGRTLLEVAVYEVYEGKLSIDYDASHLEPPEKLRV